MSKIRKASPRKIPSLKRTLWKWLAQLVKQNTDECYTCGKLVVGREKQAGHFISRRMNSTIYDLRNIRTQCSRCNFNGGNVGVFSVKLRKEIGDKSFDELVKRSVKTHQWDEGDLGEMIAALKEGSYIEKYEGIYQRARKQKTIQ